ncbi:hypothetical protein COT49_02775 [candidate division WWE3 bacterium CG08_land_8_20_14_0_20_40_13]|uniref:CYTH domain-containing protein n=1 Tax=candidate division WWE3 bacterium CG08_land_8_20_14_0_20_40_13 TaxID=1975084 RepID=A0A2H0XDJ5_UNCKA|nr:MAG: hypothetical protein COT49_02775 [candidate division WWE3 bacterium CG08_land_8_20_14_0_20_40_13]
MEEIEVKFLTINQQEIENKLVKIGATKVFDRIFKRKVFDYPDLKLDNIGAYVRLRDEGETITLAYKRRIGMAKDGLNDKGLEEIEIIVSDFDNASVILEKIGLKEKLNEEQRRIRYSLGTRDWMQYGKKLVIGYPIPKSFSEITHLIILYPCLFVKG